MKIKEAVIKKWFDVKVEVMLPATISYRIFAEDAEQAASLIKHQAPVGIKHRLIGKKDLKITVYDMGCSVIKWLKRLV